MITIRNQVVWIEREIIKKKMETSSLLKLGKISQSSVDNELKTMESIKQSLILMPKECSIIELK